MPYPILSWALVALAAAFVVVMAPVSVAYDRVYRRTIAEYAQLRRDRGASPAAWPPRSLRRHIFLSPMLLLLAAGAAAALSVLGAVDDYFRTDPLGKLPGFVAEPRLEALVPAVAVGVAFAVVLCALAIRGFASPWWPVQSRLRAAAMARGDRHAQLLQAALALDPELDTADPGLDSLDCPRTGAHA